MCGAWWMIGAIWGKSAARPGGRIFTIPTEYRYIGPFGRINWSHLNNILTMDTSGAPLSLAWRAKFRFLGWRIRRGFANAQVVSAESNYSLECLRTRGCLDPILSVNGSDDELAALQSRATEPPDDVAGCRRNLYVSGRGGVISSVPGTSAKASSTETGVIGEPTGIPAELRNDANVEICGSLDRRDVIRCLRRARYFINTTYAENSFNCAAEGIFLAAQSYISAIAPHRELLAGESCNVVAIPGLKRELFYVERQRLRGVNLRSWHDVILAMTARVRDKLQSQDAINAGLRGVPLANSAASWSIQGSR